MSPSPPPGRYGRVGEARCKRPIDARLKVFCATSGFHDSIVAVPSKPAALKAWGAKTDLFSMGVATLVTDPKIAKKALDRPGEVIRLKRSGSGEEASEPKRKVRKAARRPSRSKLEMAERRVAGLEEKQARELEAIKRELRQLETKRDRIAARHAKARAEAELNAERAREAYRSALLAWEEV